MRTISLAMRSLPKGEIRRRYERELMADLYGMTTKRQAMYAGNVLLTCRSLRRAMLDAGAYRGESNVMITFTRIPLRCRLNLKHHWVSESIEGSHEHILVCSRCGKEPPGGGGVSGNLASFGGGGGGF
jgi:hypothetical protein